MTVDLIIVFVTIVLALVLFFTETVAVEMTAMIVMAILILTGVLSPSDGISGFSNPATITVGAMFILSAGLFRTGALNSLATVLIRQSQRHYNWFLIILMGSAGIASAFLNNTAVVALLLPVVIKCAHRTRKSPSKTLMMLSFSAMLGGVCTLIGTSTNILVSSVSERQGHPALTMFEFVPFGLVVFGAGLVYMFFASRFIIPDRGLSTNLQEEFGMGEYLAEIIILPESRTVGKTVRGSPLLKELDIDVIEIYRKDNPPIFPHPNTVILGNDILLIRGNVEKIKELQERQGIQLKPNRNITPEEAMNKRSILIEAIVSPNSSLINKTLKEINFRDRFHATVLAIKHHESLVKEKLGRIRLSAGDALLIESTRPLAERLMRTNEFVIASEVGLPEFDRKKILLASLIIAAVVLSAALGLVSIVAAAIVGSIALVLSRCISLEDCYKAVEWKVIFLLAGVLSLGAALENTGGAKLIADAMIRYLGAYGPHVLLSSFFLITVLFTNFMSNNATAALLAPIAIIAADAMAVSAKPFIMAVAYAASLSFFTPVGYQTNTMIYGPGNYKFFDFTRVGLPLNVMLWLLATWLLPYFFPF